MAGRGSRDGLVAAAVAGMKELILARDPGASIGALPEIAEALGVGIVTIRQAARLLEHDGFLKVRRGHNGGFYGARPDAAVFARAIASIVELNASHEREAIEIMTLLDCDLLAAAALATDEALRSQLGALAARIDSCDTAEQRASFVTEMHDILFRMVDRPLMEMMIRWAMHRHAARVGFQIYEGSEGARQWKQQRHAIIHAIVRRDADLARFEAQRRRDYVLQRLTGDPKLTSAART